MMDVLNLIGLAALLAAVGIGVPRLAKANGTSRILRAVMVIIVAQTIARVDTVLIHVDYLRVVAALVVAFTMLWLVYFWPHRVH